MGLNTQVYSDQLDIDREDNEKFGNISGLTIVNKFGHSEAIGTSFTPVSEGEEYQTPTTAQTLEIVSTEAQDAAGGTGAREVTIQGLDSSWNLVETTVVPTGATPATIDTDFVRVFRAYVSQSGTYATASAGSHAGTLTIQDSATSSVTWAKINAATGFPLGQTEIAAYTIPAGKKGLVKNIEAIVNSNKVVDAIMFQRTRANDTTAPYGAMRVVTQARGIKDMWVLDPHSSLGVFDQYTDIGFLARVASGTGEISIDFEIHIYDR